MRVLQAARHAVSCAALSVAVSAKCVHNEKKTDHDVSRPQTVGASTQMRVQDQLLRISPIDGRYARVTASCADYFSEYALNKYRVRVEVEYLLALIETLPDVAKLTPKQQEDIRAIYQYFDVDDAATIKATERITNHDVKAVEYFVKEKLDALGLQEYREYVHFALTSEDVNCTANPLTLKDFITEVYRPTLEESVLKPLRLLADELTDVTMLAKTHGQPATPTRLGKEIMVFVERIERQLSHLDHVPFSGKFGGATGGYNAHNVAYPQIDWVGFGNTLYRDAFGMDRQQFTTQIEHYDDTAALFDCTRRINTILMDFSKDMWQYISMEYFNQKVIANEVGSSAMPHKVNPIDFENAEGNFGLANAIFEHLSNKLPISRLQRDLTDSTVRRNYGVPLAHTLIGFASLKRGIDKLILNDKAVAKDLNACWAITAEAVQTILRRERFDQPYEALKAATRGQQMNEQLMKDFIETLQVTQKVKEELHRVTPDMYARAALFPRELYESRKTH
eukprot:GEMP01042674.1.p1 GENE.GEMP01042674.1~~GEMP01042674.1.p1  ORF type:complete len:508 (+),score=129.51 GEMP01042674.1:55-1578(+)